MRLPRLPLRCRPLPAAHVPATPEVVGGPWGSCWWAASPCRSPQVLRGASSTSPPGPTRLHPDPLTPAAGLTWRAGLFMAVAVAQQLLAIGATYVGRRVGWTATNGLRADLARHCLALDLGFHKQRTPGELIERIDGDVTAWPTSSPSSCWRSWPTCPAARRAVLLALARVWRSALPYTAFVALALTMLFSHPGPRRALLARPSARPAPSCSASSKSAWGAPRTSAPAGPPGTSCTASTSAAGALPDRGAGRVMNLPSGRCPSSSTPRDGGWCSAPRPTSSPRARSRWAPPSSSTPTPGSPSAPCG